MKNGCAGCHGLEGQGAPTSGPRIGPNPLPIAALIKYVRAPKNQMPPYTSKVMSDEDLTDVRAFLAARPKPAAATVLAPSTDTEGANALSISSSDGDCRTLRSAKSRACG